MAMKTDTSTTSAILVSAMLVAVCLVVTAVPAACLTETSRTHANKESFSNGSGYGISEGGRPPPPHTVWGYTYCYDGTTPLYGCTVTVTNLRTGESVVAETYPEYSAYIVYDGNFTYGFVVGDLMNVTATKGAAIGWNESYITANELYWDQIDVTLNAEKFVMNLVTGWNFVSLPLVGYGYKASTLGLNSGDIVSEWNSTTKSYKSHIVGIPVNDFAISPGAGYEINVPSGTRTLALYGIVPTASQSKTITVPAGGGWATVGFVGKNTTRHASDIPAMYSVPGSITMVSTWNPVTKTYKNWLSVIPAINNFVLTPGLAYWIYASTSGTLSYGPVVGPVASFTYTVVVSTVHVNASGSSDDHGIASYEWDWGDGTTGNGVTASHTYFPRQSVPTGTERSLSVSGRGSPHTILGYTYKADGVTLLPGCGVTITNPRTAETMASTSDPVKGFFSFDAGNFALGYLFGEVVNVTAVKGASIGWTVAPIDGHYGFDWMTVSLSGVWPPPITLTVTDTIGQTGSVQRDIDISDAPPTASFTCSLGGLTVEVDPSSSIDDHRIVTYFWSWGDGYSGYTSSGINVTHGYFQDTINVPGGAPDPPYPVYGYIYDPNGSVVPDCIYKAQNMRTGEFAYSKTDIDGIYYFDVAHAWPGYWAIGDVVNVTAYHGALVGYSEFVAGSQDFQWMDVHLGNYSIPPMEVTITLWVVDELGQSNIVTQKMTLDVTP